LSVVSNQPSVISRQSSVISRHHEGHSLPPIYIFRRHRGKPEEYRYRAFRQRFGPEHGG
jgi:hypothetical protein